MTIAQRLSGEFEVQTPEVWLSIRAEIAQSVAAELLAGLAGLPSPQGRLLYELHTQMTEAIRSPLQRGA